ncbi:hypothetical protein R3P38DRAFT_2772411 [Favolaschia claudopus]|uniref:Uncharacterized protein n=1 Tax=Favolaschia claudopus TaxID=2862362 RepID=A0AAW0C670_9AGAR
MFSYCIPARDDDDGRDAEAQAGYGCGACVEAGDGVGKEQDRQWMTSRNGDGTTELRACRVVSKARDSNNRVKKRDSLPRPKGHSLNRFGLPIYCCPRYFLAQREAKLIGKTQEMMIIVER